MPHYRPHSAELTAEQHGLRQNSRPLGSIAVVAAAQHAARARWQTDKAFAGTAEVAVPEGLPEIYAGTESTQLWTRNARNWRVGNALAWTLSRINNGPSSLEDMKAIPGLIGQWIKAKSKLGAGILRRVARIVS